MKNIANSILFFNVSSPGKLLFAEDTMEEDPASKDSVAHPKVKKGNTHVHVFV